jgi:hypothetical protein
MNSFFSWSKVSDARQKNKEDKKQPRPINIQDNIELVVENLYCLLLFALLFSLCLFIESQLKMINSLFL